MTDKHQVIALCSVGSLGKYLCDELLAHGRYTFVVISRQSNKGAFFEQRGIDVRPSDYSTDSVLRILNETNATTFISFNNSPDETFVTVHSAFLEACRKSKNCKRFVTSEFAGNIDDFPLLPSFFRTSRVPFRKILEQQNDVEWTIFNNGWLMDYFLTEDKTYMPSIPNEFPVDPNNWKACIRGTGDQLQSFTSARDIAKALIMLLSAPEWVGYSRGQSFDVWHLTFLGAHDIYHWPMGVFQRNDRPIEKTYRSKEQIDHDTNLPPTAENLEALYLASVEEMMITESGACPREKTIRQRGKFFENLTFTTLEGLLLQTGSSRGLAEH
ncbi:MAG: hypothetical protein LQ348_007072 [Seirophora lacunosa]|nr:MAG: hypothetical protein LQ348_007072 [Seirophora lacunosa]